MSFEEPGAVAPVDQPCRYGTSKLLCRGPKREIDGRYLAFLGGSETYGKFVAQPFPALLERDLGLSCLNLGSLNAGLDAMLHDPELPGIARKAALCVLQVPGAQNLSNRFYRVHPRRNDRFLEPTPLLASIYREVDFTEFNFNNHLLATLQRTCPERFAPVRDELRQVWLDRMRLLLARTGPHTLLLWLRAHEAAAAPVDAQPALVERRMLEALRSDVIGIASVRVASAAQDEELRDMVFGPLQAPAAGHMIGPAAHRKIAAALGAEIAPALRPRA